MKLLNYLGLITLLIAIFSCNKEDSTKIIGEWREFLNDTIVIDYRITQDTIFVRDCRNSMFVKIPYFYKDSTYFDKYDSSQIFKITTWKNSDTLTIFRDGCRNSHLIRLRKFNNKLPHMIKFDLDSKFQEKDSLVDGLKGGDYKLNLDGTYKFYFGRKMYSGNISDTLLKELIYNLNFVDTTDKSQISHYFEIHLIETSYKLDFVFCNKIEFYNIAKRQPTQFNRVTYSLEQIWYYILNKSGHHIM
jgi:hypothetical protein